jgi:DNA repair protein RecN (Recombination protein N)
LQGFSDISEQISALEKNIQASVDSLLSSAKVISGLRKAVCKTFESNVHQLMSNLSMPNAKISIEILTTDVLNNDGIDQVTMMFAPNKGSNFLPIKDTASGGEISRLNLCIKSIVAGAMTLPTLVLDEIDAGVSGDVAQKMGNILSTLSSRHQIICITHSPQIAAKADSHFWVYKSDLTDRTVTAMRSLTMEERIHEIATMLSGNPPSLTAKANAIELIKP